jgi:hypothetical protein
MQSGMRCWYCAEPTILLVTSSLTVRWLAISATMLRETAPVAVGINCTISEVAAQAPKSSPALAHLISTLDLTTTNLIG